MWEGCSLRRAGFRCFSRLMLICCGAFLLTVLAESAPSLKGLQPRGAQRGQAFRLIVVGEGLDPAAQINTTLPATISRLAPARETADSELPLLVQLRDDAPIGVYP